MVGGSPERGTARRCLFGKANRTETDEDLKRLHEQQTAAASQRWAFNFTEGQPMAGVNRYVWEPVDGNEYIPPAYSECVQKLTTVVERRNCCTTVLSAPAEIPVAVVTEKVHSIAQTVEEDSTKQDETFTLQTDAIVLTNGSGQPDQEL